jgi:hypothetical protein
MNEKIARIIADTVIVITASALTYLSGHWYWMLLLLLTHI